MTRKSKFHLLPRTITGVFFFSFLIYYTLLVRGLNSKNQLPDETEKKDLVTEEITSSPDQTVIVEQPEEQTATEPVDERAELPTNINLAIDFMSQAPLAVWDQLHEDACEEASLLIVKHYIDDLPIGSPESFDTEINDLVDYENTHSFGPSITLQDLNQIAAAKFNLTGAVKTTTVESIKIELATGRPVIVGAAGKILPNPNFRNGGPNYHMLVIKGYTATEFITNDPGTRKGHNFVYKYDDLMNSIHNWDSDNILNGAKEFLVFSTD